MSQKDAIRDVLNYGFEISPLEALTRFGCMRLGARIYELRAEGLDIETRFDDDGHYAIYSLKETDDAADQPQQAEMPLS